MIPVFLASEDNPCLKPRGHCDRTTYKSLEENFSAIFYSTNSSQCLAEETSVEAKLPNVKLTTHCNLEPRFGIYGSLTPFQISNGSFFFIILLFVIRTRYPRWVIWTRGYPLTTSCTDTQVHQFCSNDLEFFDDQNKYCLLFYFLDVDLWLSKWSLQRISWNAVRMDLLYWNLLYV